MLGLICAMSSLHDLHLHRTQSIPPPSPLISINKNVMIGKFTYKFVGETLGVNTFKSLERVDNQGPHKVCRHSIEMGKKISFDQVW